MFCLSSARNNKSCESCPLEAGAGWSEWIRSSSRRLCVKRKGHISPGGPPGDRPGGHRRSRSFVRSMREQLRGGMVGNFIESP